MVLRTRESHWVTVGGMAAVVVGLSLTAPAVFSPRVRAFFADSPDSVDIARYAAQATPRDMLRWWSGVWIQASSGYFRPISSMLFWAEYQAFGRDFTGYAAVSWVFHGIICLLLFRLGLRLLSGDTAVRTALALTAVLLFNVRWSPMSFYWLSAPIAYSVVAWFPAQTDQLSLLFTLWALTCFAGYLDGGRARFLGLAGGLWVVSLLCKEMPVIAPGLAAVLVAYRCRAAAWRLWTSSPEDHDRRRFAPGVFWTTVFPSFVFVGGFLALRSILVPGAWGGHTYDPGYLLAKMVRHSFAFPLEATAVRGPWVVIVSGFVATCLYVYARLPRRPGIHWLVLILLLGSGALAQVFAGNFALITAGPEVRVISSVTILLLGCTILFHVRHGPSWPLLAMVVIVQLPILEMQGPHYEYWPAAFWALFHASLLGFVWQQHKAGTLPWRVRSARRDESPAAPVPAEREGAQNGLSGGPPS